MINDERYNKSVKYERYKLLVEINKLMDTPMIFLAFIWLALLIVDLIQGLSPILVIVNFIVWMVFLFDFTVSFLIAPDKIKYIKKHWLTGLSVILPAFRIIRALKALRFLRLGVYARSVNLLRLVTSLRRGTNELRSILNTNSLGFFLLITVLMTFIGAAGMAYFESPASVRGQGFTNVTGLSSYWDALWWTAMIMTTTGTNYWPVTSEGRILCFLLALYAFVFFGYIAANIASHFINIKKENK